MKFRVEPWLTGDLNWSVSQKQGNATIKNMSLIVSIMEQAAYAMATLLSASPQS